jgi:hypothetical protein
VTNQPQQKSLIPPDNAAAIAHLNTIQGVVSRLANNSASSKTWCVTAVAALLSLGGAEHDPHIFWIAIVPILVFGYMDTMYLAQERAFRSLYGRLVGKMRDGSYGMQDLYETGAPVPSGGFISALFSWSCVPVYFGLLVLVLAARFA